MPNETRELKQIADRYARFAADEARGSSEIYERLAQAVAGSIDVLEFLATLPAERRQPNLFLAAVRHLFGVPSSGRQLVDIVRRKHQPIRKLMLSRTTQTNEPARCAVMAFCRIVTATTTAWPGSSLRRSRPIRRRCLNVKLVGRCQFRTLCRQSHGALG